MSKITQDKCCPFCPENLTLYHKKPILKKGTYWILTTNQWPYENSKVHLLAIYTTHAETLTEMNPEAGKELVELFQWAEREYSVPGGAFALRFGETIHSAGTVRHLHAQFIQPDRESPNYKPVRFKIGSD